MTNDRGLLEELAAVQHEIWSHWMKYLYEQADYTPARTLCIPSFLVERWRRQMEAPYSKLTERERESDREQAAKVLAVLDTPGRERTMDNITVCELMQASALTLANKTNERLHQLLRERHPPHQTSDGLPCPGTCVTLAGELEDARVRVKELEAQVAELQGHREQYT